MASRFATVEDIFQHFDTVAESVKEKFPPWTRTRSAAHDHHGSLSV